VRAHRRRIAVIFQEPRLLPHLDVADNVAFALRAAGVRRAERRRRARALLDDVGLGGFADRRVRGLSGGEQQRVALARALCAEPDLLMLDEPLAAVDPNRREGLRRLIVELQRARGVTTLLITHDRTEAAELGEQPRWRAMRARRGHRASLPRGRAPAAASGGRARRASARESNADRPGHRTSTSTT